MTKIVFLDRDTIGPTVQINRPSFEHEWVEYGKTAPEQVAERLAGADIAITNKAPIRAAQLAELPGLKMISVAATGYNVIDIDACRARGVTVSNVRGYAVNAVPEHTFALMLALRRSIAGYRQDVIDGEWQRAGQFCFFTHPIRDLANTTLGIFGSGDIGQSVAAIARGFGMRVLFAARKDAATAESPYTPFEQVLAEADVLSLHLPLTPATQNLLGVAEFGQMQRRPLIINTARGGVVDEEALVQALEAGQISGIGFDVLSSEPPAADNPLLRVIRRPDVLITPHVAWASDEAMQTLWNQCVGHVDNFQRGAPSNALT